MLAINHQITEKKHTDSLVRTSSDSPIILVSSLSVRAEQRIVHRNICVHFATGTGMLYNHSVRTVAELHVHSEHLRLFTYLVHGTRFTDRV